MVHEARELAALSRPGIRGGASGPGDTSPAARAIQLEAWRRLGPEGRVALAMRMSMQARALSRAGIAARHPEYSPEEVQRALLGLLYGHQLVRAATGQDPPPP